MPKTHRFEGSIYIDRSAPLSPDYEATLSEWVLTVWDELDLDCYPNFAIDLNVGWRRGNHTSIEWNFQNREEGEQILEIFTEFAAAVNKARLVLTEAVENLPDEQ